MDEKRYERSPAFDRLAADIMTLADRLATLNDGMFELIERDDEFYSQLLNPEGRGELAEIEALKR